MLTDVEQEPPAATQHQETEGRLRGASLSSKVPHGRVSVHSQNEKSVPKCDPVKAQHCGTQEQLFLSHFRMLLLWKMQEGNVYFQILLKFVITRCVWWCFFYFSFPFLFEEKNPAIKTLSCDKDISSDTLKYFFLSVNLKVEEIPKFYL